jgi:thymidine kinase
MDVIHQKRGRIQIIFGPMFSGKTTELIRIVKRFSIAKRSCLLIKYAKDVRYSVHGVSTHDKYASCPQQSLPSCAWQAGVDGQGMHQAR